MNFAKKNDPRFWNRWTISGAVMVGDGIFTIPSVLKSILCLSNLKPKYRQDEAEQLFRDALACDRFEVEIAFGCSGGWLANFVLDGQLYVAIGECNACPFCYQYDEERIGPSITDPAEVLQRWLGSAKIFVAASVEVAKSAIRQDPDRILTHILAAIETQKAHRAQTA